MATPKRPRTATARRTIPIRTKGGEFAGSKTVGGPGAEPPHVATAPPAGAPGANETAARGGITDTYSRYQQSAAKTSPEPVKDAAKGTDAPPLSVAVKGGNRLYVPNPDDAEWVAEHPDEALQQGRAFPSVTTCMQVLDKPALMPWAAKMTSLDGEAKLKQISEMVNSGDIEGAKTQLDEWLTVDRLTGRTVAGKEMAAAYRQKRDSAAMRGTEVHAIVEKLARGEHVDIPEDHKGYVDAYRQFREDFPEMEYVSEETMLLNKEHGYAGTADAIVKIGDKHYVLDYKTNANGAVYESVGLQLSALAKCDTVMHSDGSQTPAVKIDGGIGVGLSPKGKYTATPFRVDDHFEAFAASTRIWRAQRKTKNTPLVKAKTAADIIANT